MVKMQEKRLGQKILAFEKAQFRAELRGPLPDDNANQRVNRALM